MLCSASLTTLTGNYDDIPLLTATYFHYQLQPNVDYSPLFVSSVTIVPISVFTSDVYTSLELCSYLQYKKPTRRTPWVELSWEPLLFLHSTGKCVYYWRLLLLLLISSFNTIRTGQLCRNSIVDEFYLQDIKLMLYWCEGPYDRSIFSSLYLGRLGIGFLWVWEESRPLVKCNGSDHWRTSFTKSCSRLRDWDGSMWFLMKQ